MSLTICFYGADHKCGVTMISQCFAETASRLMADKKVVLLHTHGRYGTEYSPMVRESMESIKPYLAERLLDPGEFLGRTGWRGNLFVLGGAGETGSIFSYQPDMSKYLIESLKGSVDLIVCDSGSEIEHGLCLGSVIASDSVICVLTQREGAVARHEGLGPLYEKIGLVFSAYLINQYDRGSPYSAAYLEERLGAGRERMHKVRCSDYGMQAETDGKSLLAYPGKAFAKDMEAIVRETCMEA